MVRRRTPSPPAAGRSGAAAAPHPQDFIAGATEGLAELVDMGDNVAVACGTFRHAMLTGHG